MMELYQRIRKRREELGLSQEELAQKMGYKSRSSINKIEMGENDIPQSKIVQFARALNTTPAYLMGWEDNPDQKEKSPAEAEDLVNGDPELTEYLEELRTRDEMRMLFSITKGATKEDVMRTVAIIEALRREEEGR
ncbi:helix-turn-helix domain-containing protein [Yanshouia hominis]|uniref:Helix-turn-helix domain-containing protein n=1 Tax=Yanshouia hominis TaxID=2763673 RepID=A0ABR7NHG9_9FIRM|nr:transcriptional regulator [Yanshouia hominis]MBC8575861.1 helix-turn-helix domain-containing protein [Yanshouia hominis]